MSQALPPEVKARIDSAKKEAEARAAEVMNKAGVPPGVVPGPSRKMEIPDHIGAASQPIPARPPTPQPPTSAPATEGIKVVGAAEGAEIHLLQFSLHLTKKDLESCALRKELAEKDAKIAELEREHLQRRLAEQQETLAKTKEKLQIPDGWSFSRRVDGSYVAERPRP